MVNTRRSSHLETLNNGRYISSRTRSARNTIKLEEQNHKDSNASLSDHHITPPSKRPCRHADQVRNESSKQREEWSSSTRQSRLSSQSGAPLQNGHSGLSLMSHPCRGESKGDGDHSRNEGMEVKRSCRSRRNRFETVNQGLLFDQLVNSTAEAVLQEMDNINNIRQSRRSGEVERLRMWTDTEFENMDMYSRVKRRRKSLRRNNYGMPAHHEESSEGEEEEGTEESQEEEDEVDEEAEEAEEEENDRPYNLRQRKTVQRYQAPPIEPAHRKQRQNTLFDTHRSPARRSHIRRKKHAIHSSDTTSSSDEERFERRRAKSMARARNRCLPMNLRPEDLASGILWERVKVGASLADVDPMNLDTSVRFDSVGGLSHHIHALKEMVVFPLLYPEVFEKFKIQPPRGCLFYGPPGTGKTLVARALANECSQGDRKVSFFMRKGADCLSKWVGESERQLRLLFDQAYLMRPSIIFFDEIDGLAPVRSSRQDQIHSSIVSTLLALMDGLDNRGEIIVIGATNRLDSIDPALRRPGRFDREFLFNLPDQKARKHILQIHTRDWNPKLTDAFLEELAEKCVGYCGADIKALCTEAALVALRRRYPQIYGSSQKLQLDVSSIVLSAQDFYYAMKNIVPASQRAVMSCGHALSPLMRPLLENTFTKILAVLHRVFPHAELCCHSDRRDGIPSHVLDDGIYTDDEDSPSIFENINSHSGSPKKQPSSSAHKPFLHFTTSACHHPTSYRPRLLLSGDKGSGQSSQLAPAVLHSMEKFSVHRLDLPALYSVSARTPEESCTQVFREALRTVPSVVYMPHISDWWEAVSETVKATFLTLLKDIPSFSPILLLATSETTYSELPEELKCLFRIQCEEVINVQRPSGGDRRKFFRDLILNQAAMPPPRNRKATQSALEVLSPALPPAPRTLSEEEKRRLEKQEENTLRELRLFLRNVTKRLATDKRFNIFSKPVDIEEVSDYLEVIKEPMDLSTVMTKIDKHMYLNARDFLKDIDLICSNALEYNPDKDPGDKIIRHRACNLKDTAHAIIAAELDPDFDKLCEEIWEMRKKSTLLTVEQINSHGSAARRAETGVEDSSQNKASCAMDAGNSSSNKVTFHMKKKKKKRSQWGRGIIRRKKSSCLKKEGEEVKNDEDGESGEASELVNGELEVSTNCHEENGEETGDLSLTNDESSCDIMDGEAEQSLNNGRIEQENGHIVSTEEESSNEPPLEKQSAPLETGDKPDRASSSPKEDCVNGDTSMDSCESELIPNSIASKEAKMMAVIPTLGKDVTEQKDVASKDVKNQSESFKVNSPHPGKQEDNSVKLVCSATPQCHDDGTLSHNANTETEAEKEGMSKMKKCRRTLSEQLKDINTEHLPSDSIPLVVDHERLKNLLDLVVKKSDSLTVDGLERLYSLLSQCIYRYRRDYDKSQLIEEMERTVQIFETFL
ncbi:ATPase family AAA domain-containing protein 2B [Latimeria chalumnae]|uniref:ATPase family AAA domain-containing protein 2B n=1 Tax=Latimeria chalumnae TaxID=7897 RepID=UPI00313E9B92